MIILFDVDGTIAVSGQVITNCMGETLIKIKENTNCIFGIVGGGTFNKILYQLAKYSYLFDYIFSECGAVVYKNNSGQFDCIYKKVMISELNSKLHVELNELLDCFIDVVRDSSIESSGKNIDIRCGLIYLSFPGMSANNIIREKFFEYNKKHNVINSTLASMNSINKSFIITRGGEAGLSVCLPGWDKSQVMKLLPNIINDNNIYFFGDKCDIDGNDYPLFSHRAVKGYSVLDYNHTIQTLNSLFMNKN